MDKCNHCQGTGYIDPEDKMNRCGECDCETCKPRCPYCHEGELLNLSEQNYIRIPFRCPICLGCGNVPGGFYTSLQGHISEWASTNTSEQCRQCKGSGIVWSEQG